MKIKLFKLSLIAITAGLLLLGCSTKEEPSEPLQPSRIEVSSISLNQTSAEVIEGETITLKASVLPADATDAASLTWVSSKTSVATVSPQGIVSAISEGNAVITVSCGEKSATCTITVSAKIISVTGVSLSHATLSLTEGETASLSATVSPDNASNSAVSWTSSDPSVATVSKDGVVSALKAGSATITVTTDDGGNTATCTVTVVRKTVDVMYVILSKTEAEVEEGSTLQLSATVLPEDADDKEVAWSSSDNAVATVGNTGIVTGLKPGKATITANAGGKEATCTVTVTRKPIEVMYVMLSKTETEIEEGSTLQLSATVLPEDADDKEVIWSSSDNAIATVGNTGIVTGLKPGKATITAKAGGKEATCTITVTVKTIAVTDVSLSPTSISLTEGETASLSASVSPSNASNPAVSWTSSDPSVATVSNDGFVTALKAGTATITVTTEDGGKTASCSITVVRKTVEVMYVMLSKTEAEVEEGSTLQLSATVLPEDADDKEVAWSSSDNAVATVGNTGIVTGLKPGKVTITAKAGAKDATCTITVTAKTIEVTGVSLSPTTLNLTEGTTANLSATVSPTNASNPAVSWTSSNPSVATVSQEGVVTALKAGSATITVTTSDGGKTASCSITFVATAIPPTGITLNPTSATLLAGQTLQITATVTPKGATGSISWSSNQKGVVSVDATGKVTAKSVGTAIITAKIGDVTATCTVKVNIAGGGHESTGEEDWN